jgi:membrane protease YdiL (CAAX protease family)
MTAADPLEPSRTRTAAGAVVIGIAVMLAGTLPRNALFAANLRYVPDMPWSVPLVAVYLWFFWRYLDGHGPPDETAAARRELLRAHRVGAKGWLFAMIAGGAGIVALVAALRIANAFVSLPAQHLPDLAGVPQSTVIALLIAAAPVAGIVEEAAFRGYMQSALEKTLGPALAILLTGTMFALSHLDFTWVLWPYYLAVSALYGAVTCLTRSILPAIVLHTAGNLYSNFDLLLFGRAEWQSGGQHGDALVQNAALLIFASIAMLVSFRALRRSHATAYEDLARDGTVEPRDMRQARQ